jgi:NAD-dependent deacetylase
MGPKQQPTVENRDSLWEAANKLKAASRVLVLTGAGISQESGVPTFRGADGLWKHYRAEELATPRAFDKDPVLVWRWYDWRRSVIAPLRPNPAHYALVDLEQSIETFTLVTQNVDGLHRLAGSSNPIEIHGTLWRVKCTQCGERTWNRQVPITIPPYCEACGGLLRPDVVWFGEALDYATLTNVYQRLENTDVMLIIGTSGVVQPVASFGMVAKQSGAFVVEINRSKTSRSSFFHVSLEGKAGELLPTLVSAVAP